MFHYLIKYLEATSPIVLPTRRAIIEGIEYSADEYDAILARRESLMYPIGEIWTEYDDEDMFTIEDVFQDI